jgi:[acyl-carrier-protein] S-malonyltransferase
MAAADGRPRLAFLFPGQGSQRVGMGGVLRATDGDVLETHLRRADAASALDVARTCAHGPVAALTWTAIAQPALHAVSLAVHDVARELGLRPDAVAGHSVGEYAAAVAAGALSFADGARLVAERGRLMASAQAQRAGAMAALIGIDRERAARLCEEAAGGRTLVPANLNAPSQVVVSGDTAAVEELLRLVARDGAGRAVRLPVGAAFHSPLMIPVRRRLATLTRTLRWRAPRVPLVANASGHPVRGAEGVRRALVAQVAAPVRWTDCIEALVAAGFRYFVELGPGHVLTGLVRQIAPGVEAVAADGRARLEAFAAAHPELVYHAAAARPPA